MHVKRSARLTPAERQGVAEDVAVTTFSDLRPEVRRRLEPVVLEVFSRSDFHKANIRDVAKRAGISFSTIYHHYGSKEQLVFAFVDIWLGKLTERIIDHLQGIESLKETLRKVVWLQLDYYEKNPGLGRILFMTLPMQTWMSDRTFRQPKMIDLFLEVLRRGQQEGLLNSRVRTGVLLDFILGMVQRSFCMWISRGQKEGLAAQSNTLFDMLWRAISNPDAPEHTL
jgi:AcrR family transcriptional regulator